MLHNTSSSLTSLHQAPVNWVSNIKTQGIMAMKDKSTFMLTYNLSENVAYDEHDGSFQSKRLRIVSFETNHVLFYV